MPVATQRPHQYQLRCNDLLNRIIFHNKLSSKAHSTMQIALLSTAQRLMLLSEWRISSGAHVFIEKIKKIFLQCTCNVNVFFLQNLHRMHKQNEIKKKIK